ncbi:MAG: DMT family transporter [Gammaproteobacteria bacterium]|nr:DMT family transporter [Gammaproteobacteria bacterium]
MNLKNNGNPGNSRLGIALVVVGLCTASLSGALMKLLSEDLNVYQIAWFRFMFSFLSLLPVAAVMLGPATLRPGRLGMHLFRGLTMSGATVCFVIGARTIEFSDAIAILYAYPFLLTVLAVLFLGEQVRWSGWAGLVGGFAGVLLVMRPEFDNVNTGVYFVFLCAVIISIQMVINRKLGSVSHPLVTALWGSFSAAASLSVVLPYYWEPVDGQQFWLLCLIALTGTVTQTCLVYGFSKAEASAIAPFTYLEIVAAILIGYLFFGTLPNWISWSGIGLIVVSGIIVARSLGGPSTARQNPKY